MLRKLSLLSLGAGLAITLWSGLAAAQDPAAAPSRIPLITDAAPVPPGPVPPATEPAPAAAAPAKEEKKPPEEHCRKNPVPGVAWYAKPSFNQCECGYYVVGGCLCFGTAPQYERKGTWGWDYIGCIPKRVQLLWCHHCKYQGGIGAYRTDGPNYIEKIHEKQEERREARHGHAEEGGHVEGGHEE